MKEIALEEEIHRLGKELRLAGSENEMARLELRVQIDRLRLELTALKAFLNAANPTFAEQFPQILADTIQNIDPEAN